MSLAKVMREGILSAWQQTNIISLNSTFSTNLIINYSHFGYRCSCLMRIQYPWLYPSFSLVVLILFKNQLSLCLFALIIWILKTLRTMIFQIFCPILSRLDLIYFSTIFDLSATLLPFSLISMKCYQHSALWVLFLTTCFVTLWTFKS